MPQPRHIPSAMHADIQTPTWRPFTPSARPPTDEDDISSDDTSDIHYRRLHAAPLQAERARWAPPTPNPSSCTPKKTRRPAPLFPTPAESVAITQRALNSLKPPRRARREAVILSARRAALTKFDRTLSTFNEIEASLAQHLTTLQNHARDLYNQAICTQGATLRLPFSPAQHPPGHADAVVEDRMANGGHTEEEVPAHMAVATVVGGALADLDDLQLIMIEKSKAFADRVAAMAEQAKMSLGSPITCETLRQDIARTKRMEDEARKERLHSVRVGSKLSEAIKKEIDSDLYPLLAESFWLHGDYRLDGTRRPVEDLLQLEMEEEEQGHMYKFGQSSFRVRGGGNGQLVDDDEGGLQVEVMGGGGAADKRWQRGMGQAGRLDDCGDGGLGLDVKAPAPGPGTQSGRAGRTGREGTANGVVTRSGRCGRVGDGAHWSGAGRATVKKEKRVRRTVNRPGQAGDGVLLCSDGSELSDVEAERYVSRRTRRRRGVSSSGGHRGVSDSDGDLEDYRGGVGVVELDDGDDSSFGM